MSFDNLFKDEGFQLFDAEESIYVHYYGERFISLSANIGSIRFVQKELDYGFGLSKFSEVFNMLLKVNYSVESRLYTVYSNEKKIFNQNELITLVKEIKREFIHFDLDKIVCELSKDLPMGDGMNQLNHIVSLVLVEDFDTLMKYRSYFKKGKSNLFVPMITERVISLALDMSIRNL